MDQPARAAPPEVPDPRDPAGAMPPWTHWPRPSLPLMGSKITVSPVWMRASARFFALFGVVVILGLLVWFLPVEQRDATVAVRVTDVIPSGENLWRVPRGVLDRSSFQQASAEVSRLRHLRIQRLSVRVVEQGGNSLVLGSNELRAGDLLILEPGGLPSGQPAVPTAGVDSGRLIRLTVDAGMAAVMAEDLEETIRFLAPDYRDSLGLTKPMLGKVLERTYREFDSPQVELAEPPEIRVTGDQAQVRAKLRASALYRGRHNFLLGDEHAPNALLLTLSRFPEGWRVSGVEGIRPLGFDEGFLRLLAAQVGFGLTKAEEERRQRACMPCRQRMAERFGPPP